MRTGSVRDGRDADFFEPMPASSFPSRIIRTA
jgi:hypothetical protein